MEGPNENEQDNKIGQYKVKDKIGEGSFGQIYEVEKEGKIYAIKTVMNITIRKIQETLNQ